MQAQDPTPLAGYLHKMKNKECVITPQWTTRYFALQGSELKYYASENANAPSKTIDLLSIESVRRFENGDHGAFSFVLKTPERSYFLRADSKGEMNKWVRGLQEQQDLWRVKLNQTNDEPQVDKRRPKHYRESTLGAPMTPQTSNEM